MTEWTSLSVTEEQKRKIETAQEQAGHDGAIGRFIVQQLDDGGKQGRGEQYLYINILDDDNAQYIHDMWGELEKPTEEYLIDGIKYHHDDPEDLTEVDPTQVDPDKLMGKLNTIEAAAKEATNAAQKTQSTVEDRLHE